MKKITKKGIPKKRLPQGLEGIIRSGKIIKSYDDFFIVETKHQGRYIFKKEGSKIFNKPNEAQKVYICFDGFGKETYFPYKICDLENKRIFYKK